MRANPSMFVYLMVIFENILIAKTFYGVITAFVGDTDWMPGETEKCMLCRSRCNWSKVTAMEMVEGIQGTQSLLLLYFVCR